MAGDTTPQDLAQEMDDYLEQGWSCPPDAQRMMAEAVKLLRAKDEGGSLRSMPPAAGPQWAVLRRDDDVLYETEATARRHLWMLDEDGEDGHRLYEVREVSGG
jgi:hypothetical protein